MKNYRVRVETNDGCVTVWHEKAKLNKRRLRVRQVEHAFHVRHEYVVETGNETYHEKQNSHSRKRTTVTVTTHYALPQCYAFAKVLWTRVAT